MRLFTGLSIENAVLRSLENLLDELRPLAPLNWTPPQNLHITTKFIGEWPEARLAELQTALTSVTQPGKIPVRVSQPWFFPNPLRPKALFATIQAGSELHALARRIEDALEQIGIAPEERPYLPHITLARIKGQDIRNLRDHIASMTNINFGSFEAVKFHLFLSRGSVYTKLSAYPLVPAAC